MEDAVGLVRTLITDFKLRGGPRVSPAEICGHIARELNISETAAAALILQAALVDVEVKQREMS
jgi:hypothetical protein